MCARGDMTSRRLGNGGIHRFGGGEVWCLCPSLAKSRPSSRRSLACYTKPGLFSTTLCALRAGLLDAALEPSLYSSVDTASCRSTMRLKARHGVAVFRNLVVAANWATFDWSYASYKVWPLSVCTAAL